MTNKLLYDGSIVVYREQIVVCMDKIVAYREQIIYHYEHNPQNEKWIHIWINLVDKVKNNITSWTN